MIEFDHEGPKTQAHSFEFITVTNHSPHTVSFPKLTGTCLALLISAAKLVALGHDSGPAPRASYPSDFDSGIRAVAKSTQTTLQSSTLNLNSGNGEAETIALTIPILMPSDWNQATGMLTGSGVLHSGYRTDTENDARTFTGDITDGLAKGGSAEHVWRLNKIGDGTLILTGELSYSGETTIESGVIQIGDGHRTGSISGNIINNGALIFNRSDELTYASVISGSGSLIHAGTGITTLTGLNTYSGKTHVQAGTLIVGSVNGLPSGTVLTVDEDATLDIRASGLSAASISGGGKILLGTQNLTIDGANTNTTFSGVISGTGTLTKTGSGILILTGNNTYSGDTRILGGTLQIGDGGSSGGILGSNIENNGILAIKLKSDVTYSRVITGSGDLHFIGTNNVKLTAQSRYTGKTIIESGTLSIGVVHALPTGTALTVNNDGVLKLNGFDATFASIEGTGSIQLGTKNITTGGNNKDTTFAGVISGEGNLIKNGSGILTLTGINTYTGDTFINAGTVITGTTGAINSTSSVSISDDATFVLSRADQSISGLNGSGTVLLGSATLTVGSNDKDSTFNGTITGTGGLIKTGAGSLLLGKVNSFTGTTHINAGSIEFNIADSIASSAGVEISSGAILKIEYQNQRINALSGDGLIQLGDVTLTLANDTSTRFAGQISGDGDIVKTGAETLILTTASTHKGTTTISEGILTAATADILKNSSALRVAADGVFNPNGHDQHVGTLSGAGRITLGGAVLTTTNAGSTTFSGIISGDGGLTKNGAGTLNLTGQNTYEGTTTLDAGSLSLGVANAIANSAELRMAESTVLTLSGLNQTLGGLSGLGEVALNSTTLTVGHANGKTTYAGVIRGSGSLVKVGSGSLTLTGLNLHTGTTTVSSGILRLGITGALSSASTIQILESGTLDLANINQTIRTLRGTGTITLGTAALTLLIENTGENFGGTISGTGSLVKSGSEKWTLSGNALHTGDTTVQSGILEIGDGGTSGVVIGNIFSEGSVHLNRADDYDFTAILSGAGSLRHTGSGITTLTNRSTHTGATAIDRGTLRLGIAGALASGSQVTIAPGATLDLAGFAQTLATVNGAGNLAIGTGSLTLAGPGNSSVSGLISGAGNLIKNGVGTLTLGGANTFSGSTLVNVGTLTFSAANALSASNITVDTGASISLNGLSQRFHSLTGAGTVDLTSATLTTGGTNSTFGGRITGAGNLVKEGGGIFTLNKAAEYTGTTTIEAGTLKLGAGNAISTSSSVTVASGGKLDLGGFNQRIGVIAGTGEIALNGATLTTGAPTENSAFAGAISGTGSLVKEGAGILTLSGNNTYVGSTTITSGTLQAGSAKAFGTGNALVVNKAATADIAGQHVSIGALSGAGNVILGSVTVGSGTLTTAMSTDSTFSGEISGKGSLVKQGVGILTLTGKNTYTGATQITAGVIRAGASEAFSLNSSITVNAGALLDLQNFTQTIGSLAGAGKVSLGSATLTTGGDNATTIFSGEISGTGGLTKEGTGSLILTGTSTYSGTTTINNGSIVLQSSTAINPLSAVIISENGSLGLGDNHITVGSLAGMGNLNLGTGSLTTGGDNSNTIYNGRLDGAGAFIKEGKGEILLLGKNTYSGATSVNNGILAAGGANVFSPTSMIDIAAGAILALNNHAQTVGSIAGEGTILLGTATLTTGGSHASSTFSGEISGAGGITKTGDGTLTLSGVNTYTGPTTIESGVLITGSVTALGSQAALTIQTGARLELNNLDITIGKLTGTGNVTLGSGTLSVGDGNGSSTFAGVISGTNPNARSGATNGGLTKIGTGILTLSGANTYTGTTTIQAGTLRMGTHNALGSASALSFVAGATLDLNNFNLTIGSLSGGGDVTLGTGALIAGGDNQRTTYTGKISGDGRFTKTGGGTMTLTGDNLHKGGTVVNGGVLLATATDALGAGTVDITGATLRTDATINTGSDLILRNGGRLDGSGALVGKLFDLRDGVASIALTGAGNLVKSTGGTVVLSGANTYSGGTSVTGGTLKLIGIAAVAGDIAVNAGATVMIENNADATLSTGISGQGTFVKSGSGTLTVESRGGITGTTRADSGRLVLVGNTSVSTGNYAVASGAEIEFGAHNGTLVSNLAGDGTFRFSGAGTTVIAGTTTGNALLAVDSGHKLNLGGAADSPANLGYSVYVAAGAELRGSASLRSLTNDGRLNIGASPGTVVLSGDFVNSGVLDIEIAGSGAGQFDVIKYAGSATIHSGSTLNIIHLAGYTPTDGDHIIFLEDTDLTVGTFTGSFTTENLPTLAAGLGSAVVKTTNGMAYTVFSKSIPTQLRARKGTEQFVAKAPDNTAGYTPIAANGVLNGNEWMTAALTSASPIGLSAMEALIIDENRTNTKFLMGRARAEMSERHDEPGSWNAFADVHGAFSNWEYDLYEGGTFNQRFFGGKAGIAYRATHEIVIGNYFGYDNGHATLHNGAGKINQNRGSYGGYISYAPAEDTFAFAAISAGLSRFATTRNTITGTETGDADTYDVSATLGFGKTFRLSSDFDTTSYVNLTYTWINTDAFTEGGSDFAARIASRNNDSLRFRVGQELAWTLPLAEEVEELRFALGVAYEHECLKDDAKIRGAFTNGTGDFTVHGDTLSRNSVVVTPSLTWKLAARQSVSASYSYEYGFSKMHSNRFDVAYRIGL